MCAVQGIKIEKTSDFRKRGKNTHKKSFTNKRLMWCKQIKIKNHFHGYGLNKKSNGTQRKNGCDNRTKDKMKKECEI